MYETDKNSFDVKFNTGHIHLQARITIIGIKLNNRPVIVTRFTTFI